MGKSRHAPRVKTLAHLSHPVSPIGLAITSILIIIFALPAVYASEEMTLEIIPLSSTTAEQALPLLEPFIAPGGTLTGKGQKLIVKTTGANLAEIKTILNGLDVAPRQLRISVTQDVDQVRRYSNDSVHARYRSGNVSAGLGTPGHGGAEINYRDSDGNLVGYRGARTRTRREDNNTHFVTALEGRPSFIFTGEATPYVSQSIYGGPFGGYAQTNVDLVQTDRGFYVTPRVNGEQVNLEISTRLDEAPGRQNGIIQSRGVDTVVSGRLGDWIPLGGANRTASTRQGEILASTRGRSDNAYEVWVKVELSP